MVWRPSVTSVASAERIVVDHSACSVVSTQTRARVNALLFRPTRLCLGTVAVGDALRPAAGVWVTLGEALKTLADCNSVFGILL